MSNVGYVRSFRAGLSILAGVVFALATSGIAYAVPPQIVINSAKVQVVLSPTNSSNHANISTIFTNNGDDGCHGDDAISDGLEITLANGTCASHTFSFIVSTGPFDMHIIGRQRYGTLFGDFPLQGVTISLKLTALPPPAEACGQWNLNFEGTGAFLTSGFNIGDSVSVAIRDQDGDFSCFDVPAKDTIIGNSIQ